MTTPRLFVIGDSFTVEPLNGEDKPYWIKQAADEIEKLSGKPVIISNASMMGSSQDWVSHHIQALYNGQITPDDYLVVALTHPNRFWYNEKRPDVTNPHLTDLDEFLTKEETRAVELFMRHIQRPLLDTIHLQNRLAYIAYQTRRQKLHRPVVIKCFEQQLGQCEFFPELNWANGVLMDNIQRPEFWDPDLDENAVYWRGIDPRYNHMCMSNHNILGPRLGQALHNDTALDLVNGYNAGIVQPGSLDDPEWVKREINPVTVQYNIDNGRKYKSMTSWAVKMGIREPIFKNETD
jgi:hypothetical protein